jgi:MFS family permease
VAARLAASAVTRWRNAVMIAFALGGVTVATWGPRLPELRADLGMGDAWIGLVLAGVTVGSITGLAAAAALLSWLGSRGGICAMLWLVAVGIAGVGLGAGVAHSAWSTALGFVFVGFGIGAVDVMINVEGAAVERAAGKTLMPLLHAAWSAGAVVGAGIGAGGAAMRVPVAEQFVAEAVLICATAAAAVRFLPATPRASTGARPRRWGERVGAWLRGWGSLRLLLIGLVMLGVELGEGTANSWLTLAVRDGHGQPDAVAALFFVAFAVGETLARVFGGPVVDRIGRVRAVRVTTGLGAVGLVVFILASSGWLVLLGTLLWAVGVSMGFPLGMSAAAESGPNPAARVSVVASIGYLANLGGPPLIGFLSETVGVLTALWTLVVLLVIGFVASDALRSPRSIPAS